MKSIEKIKKFLNENKAFMKYKSKKVIFTNHGVERKAERIMGKDVIETLSKKAIQHIKNNRKKFDEYAPSEYLFYSKSLNQGMVVDYRQDRQSDDKENHLIIITVLPKGKQAEKEGTTKVILEHSSNTENLSEEFMEYLSSTLFNGLITEGYDYEPIETDYGFKVIFCENKFWDIHGMEIIELD